ncbi:MAG: hypothetical protein J6W54_12955 [Fibrobacter sp.]|uniref:hypothetical protein n=1 Tax=Fibrobacter sp. TaxID=35828 RepID=UPI001B063F18|nr:hypothetical protein [Fibrobacter sp.]MBO7061982.1 hypothetical protein [Fibrobacter sp.]MBO7105608.1 hypothetical protein [Fibrobacter sp.]
MAMRSIIIALFLSLAAFAQEPPAYYNTQQDSVSVEYAKKVEHYTESAEHLSNAGTGLFIGGGAILALATAEVIHYTVKTKKKKGSEEYDVVEGDHGAFGLIVLAGVGCILGGTVFKVFSYKRKNRAEYYKEQIKNYQKADHSVSLEILPMFNPINQAFGGNLLLDF